MNAVSHSFRYNQALYSTILLCLRIQKQFKQHNQLIFSLEWLFLSSAILNLVFHALCFAYHNNIINQNFQVLPLILEIRSDKFYEYSLFNFSLKWETVRDEKTRKLNNISSHYMVRFVSKIRIIHALTDESRQIFTFKPCTLILASKNATKFGQYPFSVMIQIIRII